MTKEEILAKKIIRFPDEADLDFPGRMLDADIKRNVYAAMDEYAKQEAIGFLHFIKNNGGRLGENNQFVLEWCPVNDMLDPKTYSAEELYSLYQQNKK